MGGAGTNNIAQHRDLDANFMAFVSELFELPKLDHSTAETKVLELPQPLEVDQPRVGHLRVFETQECELAQSPDCN